MRCTLPPARDVPLPSRAKSWLLGGLLLLAAAAAPAQEVARLRLMLHPQVAPRGDLSAARLAKLEAIAGTPLTPAGTTRTGGLEFTLGNAGDEAGLARVAQRLRNDRAVLWAEVVKPDAAPKRATRASAGMPGNRLLVRLRDGIAADWAVLAPRFAERLGVPVVADRQIGDVWVLQLAQAKPPATLTLLAARLQEDTAVQYADPVLRKFARTVPNDPMFGEQWALTDPLSGIGAPAAWTVQQGSADIAIAVVDTGILPHPDLAGRILAGYDFISDATSARDGDGRDAIPRDEGDWTENGDCGGHAAQNSSWHGTFIAGQLAANADNGQGIAGVNWKASILPVRALGKCGGTDEDVFEGMLWASGVATIGVPANPHPARVINMSLGGAGACAQALQEAIDDALAQGSVVVVAAGNEADDATGYAPANCSGVITVGAHNRGGERAFYSNYGRRIDLSAPAGDGSANSDAIVSTSDDGTTIPAGPKFGHGIGTSFAAPYVAGTASLMLARDPSLTAGRVLDILQGTAREFPPGTTCRVGELCGAGMLDAGLALTSTPPGTLNPPPGTVPVFEYYSPALDHYFITASADEAALLDTLSGAFQRTGYFFYAFVDPALTPASARPVCRFYAGPEVLIDSHYFTANAAECEFVQNRWAGVWALEQPDAFYIEVPDAAGACPDNTTPVYRFFNNRRDANHRYTIDRSVRRAMINRTWVPEGDGPDAAVFCSRI
jgi:serine protease